MTINSNPNQAPIAGATATPPSGKRPLAVQFSSATSSDPDDSIVSYAWDFGDGDTSTDANPSHTYAEGSYTATLTVTDEEGLTGSTTVNVVSNPNQAPVAVANSSTTFGLDPGDGLVHLDRLARPRRLDRRATPGTSVTATPRHRPEPDPHLHRRRRVHGDA